MRQLEVARPVLEMSIEQALAKIASREIRDGKTIMLLQYAALHLF